MTRTIMCKTPGCPERVYPEQPVLSGDEGEPKGRVIASAAWQSHETTCYHESDYTSADCFGRASLAKTSTIMCKTVIARPLGRGNLIKLLVIMKKTTPRQIASVAPEVAPSQ